MLSVIEINFTVIDLRQTIEHEPSAIGNHIYMHKMDMVGSLESTEPRKDNWGFYIYLLDEKKLKLVLYLILMIFENRVWIEIFTFKLKTIC